MSEWYSERPDFRFYVAQAQEARAESMARAGYLIVAGFGRVLHGAGAALSRALGRVRAWRNRHAALRQLLALDDHLLQDIGLSRAEVQAAVDGTLGNRVLQPATLQPADYVDIALSGYAVGGCNDNGERRRAA